MTRWRRI